MADAAPTTTFNNLMREMKTPYQEQASSWMGDATILQRELSKRRSQQYVWYREMNNCPEGGTMAQDTLYEYAVFVWSDKDKDAVLIVPPRAVVAKSEDAVRMIAARSIPEEYASETDRTKIMVRPFSLR